MNMTIPAFVYHLPRPLKESRAVPFGELRGVASSSSREQAIAMMLSLRMSMQQYRRSHLNGHARFAFDIVSTGSISQLSHVIAVLAADARSPRKTARHSPYLVFAIE